MEGVPATYLGRLVSKENFRAFIYHPNGNKRLVNSWDEFEANMQSGVWFATPEDAQASVAPVSEEVKPKRKRAQKAEPVKVEPAPQVEEIEEVHDLSDDGFDDDGMVYEVKPEDQDKE